MTRLFHLIVNDQEVYRLEERIISLTMRDLRGFEADTLTVTLDAAGVQIPNPGAWIALVLGGIQIRYFKLDEVTHSVAPETLSLTARGADFPAGLHAQRNLSWHQVTLGELLQTIADRYGIDTAIDPDLAATTIPHLDQTGESDAHLLTRLGQQYDAVATIKERRLLFFPKGGGRSASGTQLPEITFERGDLLRWRLTNKARMGSITGVSAKWHDLATGRLHTVTIGSDQNPKELRYAFSSEADARRAAQSEWGRIRRGHIEGKITLKQGRADLIPETPIRFGRDMPKQYRENRWIAAEVEHRIDRGGYRTIAKLEVLS